MNKFNTYLGKIDVDSFKELCIKRGKLVTYNRKEFFQKAGEVNPFWGYVESGVLKYTCSNTIGDKEFNVGFSFAGEFVADYPVCIYEMIPRLSIQAVTLCKVYVCSSDELLKWYERTENYQTQARIVAEQLFLQVYSRYADLYCLTPEERYLQLLQQFPDILQVVPLKEIASYLQITPVHLSRIRRRQTFFR